MQYVMEEEDSSISSIEPRPELLCLDVGTRRTGVALSNVALGVATPVTVLHHPDPHKSTGEEILRSMRDHIHEINDLSDRNNVAGIVVGWPLEQTSGVPGRQCKIVRQYCRILKEQANEMDVNMRLNRLDMLTWDERWSTYAVLNNKQHDVDGVEKRKFRRSEIGKAFDDASVVDDLAATYILQGVLTWLRKDEYERDLEDENLDQFRPTQRVCKKWFT